jgi:hypothetical protein
MVGLVVVVTVIPVSVVATQSRNIEVEAVDFDWNRRAFDCHLVDESEIRFHPFGQVRVEEM